MTEVEFITKIAPFAVKDMRRSKVPASFTISQAALESGWGNSGLTVRVNNLFGIKGSGLPQLFVLTIRLIPLRI